MVRGGREDLGSGDGSGPKDGLAFVDGALWGSVGRWERVIEEGLEDCRLSGAGFW